MTLQFFGQPEGYVTPSAVEGSYDYVYQYVDHLGNVRLSYTDKNQNTANGVALEIVEEIDVGDSPNTYENKSEVR